MPAPIVIYGGTGGIGLALARILHGRGLALHLVARDAARLEAAAAELGATVVAVDRDAAKLRDARAEADRRKLPIQWVEADLEHPWPDFGTFEVVLDFNYLDRARMDRIRNAVAPGGVLILETYLEIQRQLGWGPERQDHLLRYGEIGSLVAPLRIVHGREAFEPADNAQWAAVASVVARRAR